MLQPDVELDFLLAAAILTVPFVIFALAGFFYSIIKKIGFKQTLINSLLAIGFYLGALLLVFTLVFLSYYHTDGYYTSYFKSKSGCNISLNGVSDVKGYVSGGLTCGVILFDSIEYTKAKHLIMIENKQYTIGKITASNIQNMLFEKYQLSYADFDTVLNYDDAYSFELAMDNEKRLIYFSGFE